MFQIAVIGAGQLGSRHLQGLAKANFDAEIWVVDPSVDSLKTAQSRYNEVQTESKIVHFVSAFSEIRTSAIDFAIIATGSIYRLQALQSLTDQCVVKYLLLEKILFPSLEQYEIAAELLKRKNIKTWVNCPMRMNDLFKSIKNILTGRFTLSISANSVGLACNGIHYLDYFAYLAGSPNIELSAHLGNMHPSKRPGYVEFEGAIHGKDEKGNLFSLFSINNGPMAINYLIQTEDRQIMIDEMAGECWVKLNGDSEGWKRDRFRVCFQSEMTGIIAETLFSSGVCELTPYAEAMKIHVQFLEQFLQYMQKSSLEKITLCPIT